MAGVSNQTVEHDAKTRGIILHIVEQIKSQGVFDRFRRDCLEELDSKEPYRQLKQRVESHVATFLSKQMFSANLPKNQLRTSLRANINQSEVLSKGVDRLLEQVLVEKSIPFYKEIENLVEEHLISTGHYTRYDRDKPQKSERDGQSRSEHAKLSDKEVEDIIKEETYKLLEATADGGKSQGSDKNSLADSPPPGTSGEVIEVETLISSNDDASTKNCQTNTNVGLIEKSEAADLNSVNAEEEPNVEMAVSGEPEVKVKTENSEQAQESKVAVAQVVIESKQCLVTSKEMDARLPVPGDSTSTCSSNEDYQVSRPEVITESNPVKSSAMLDVSLNDESEAMDVEVEPSTLEQNTLEDGKLNENLGMIPEMERSKGYPPAVEYSQAAAAALVEEASIEQQDVSKESKTEVDLRVLNAGVKLGETKAEVELKRNIPTETAVNPETEIKKDDIHEAKVDNLEIYTPEETKSGIHKPELLQTKVLQAKVVMPEVTKPKVDKTQKPEEKAKQTAAEEKSKLTSKQSVKPATKETLTIPNIFSTDEETDEDIGVIEESIITRSKPVESKPDLSVLEIAELSDSDITVSSVHTSDLSSLEDSMSDMEYEDYQELALKKNKQKNTGESSADTSKDIDSEDRKFEKSSAHTSRILHSEEESEEEECGESGAGTSQKISNQEESEEKSGESCAVGEKEVDSIKEQHEEKCEESGAGTNEDIDSKEKRNIESVDSSTDWSVLLHESSLSRSQATTPQRSETHDNPLPVSMDDDNQISHNFSQETTPSFMQFSAPAFSKNIENLVPEVEPISSYDSETAQTTDAISDADNGIALEDAEVGNPKLGQRKHRRRISTEQENESSNDIQTPGEEQREPHPQRRSARVASKDRLKSDEKDDNFHGYNKEQEKGKEGGDSSRRLRRRHSSQDKGHDLRGSRSKEERRKERAQKRAARLTSDSNDSDVKTSKRSKRQVRPTRCYSPSENS